MKSNVIVNVTLPLTSGGVARPRAVMRKVMFQKWFVSGVSARQTLPTTCVHM